MKHWMKHWMRHCLKSKIDIKSTIRFSLMKLGSVSSFVSYR